MLRRQLLSKAECRVLVQDAEAYACDNGWTTSRHATHATTDVPVQLLLEGGRLWNETIAVRVEEALADDYDLRPDSITPVEVFLVKHQFVDGGQGEQSVHRDGAPMTFSLLLIISRESYGMFRAKMRRKKAKRDKRECAINHERFVMQGSRAFLALLREEGTF